VLVTNLSITIIIITISIILVIIIIITIIITILIIIIIIITIIIIIIIIVIVILTTPTQGRHARMRSTRKLSVKSADKTSSIDSANELQKMPKATRDAPDKMSVVDTTHKTQHKKLVDLGKT
jgi:ABC-type bacteriocin/lantibiotic exporter with double-glycine peptidase domain